MAIIYIHGFASAGSGSPKVKALEEMFPNERVYAPDLNYEPQKAVEQLTSLIRGIYKKDPSKTLIVGTSLGGLYGWYLSAKFDIPAVIINPAYSPKDLMGQFLGKNKNLATDEEFEWIQEYIDKLQEYKEYAQANYSPSLLKVVTAKDDDLINYENVIKAFTHKHTEIHVFDDGGHRFNDLSKIKGVIDKSFKESYHGETLTENLFI